MPRFRKGTTDHDSDGKMGGSLKGDDMAKGTKKAAVETKAAVAPRKRTAKPAPAKAEKQQPVAEQPTGDDVVARKQAVAEQFAEADAIAEATLGRQMRGW